MLFKKALVFITKVSRRFRVTINTGKVYSWGRQSGRGLGEGLVESQKNISFYNKSVFVIDLRLLYVFQMDFCVFGIDLRLLYVFQMEGDIF